MHDTKGQLEEKAVLVSLMTSPSKSAASEEAYSLTELVRLTESAGVEVLATMTQKKDSQDSKWFIGKGKVEELKEKIIELGANTAIFDQELSGAQVRDLEEVLNVKIIDRTQLILDIFAQRAKTREGIIQVELAQLSYLLPRLSGHGKNLSRLGGGIGTRGPGESKLETDRRHIRGRISDLKAQLAEVVKHRTLHRERRRKTGVFQAALVGYTNAGKSTLLKQLTDADVYIENQLFATLDPVSRILKLPSGKEILLTDTVGFIMNLPHDLVASFRATLEEVCEADLILHVVDSSAEMHLEQMKIVDQILNELGAGTKEQITVYNKADLCGPAELDSLPAVKEAVRISAYRAEDIAKLKLVIEEKIRGEGRVFRFPLERGDLIAMAHRLGDVLEQQEDDGFLIMKVRVHRREFEKSGYLLAPYEWTNA